MKRALLAAVVTFPFFGCGGDQGAPPVDGIELPRVAGAKPLDNQDRVTIELTHRGVVRIEGRRVSLRALSEEVRKHKQSRGTHEAKMRIANELHSMGLRASDLYVLLRADRRAPWQHACYVFAVLMEEKIYRLQFAAEGGRLDAFLPIDIAIEWTEPPNEACVNADVLAKEPVRYRVGPREIHDVEAAIAAVEESAKRVRAERIVEVVGQVRAETTTKFGDVVDMIVRMRACDVIRVAFAGTVIPGAEIRALRSLPFPKRTYLVAGEYWDEEDD